VTKLTPPELLQRYLRICDECTEVSWVDCFLLRASDVHSRVQATSPNWPKERVNSHVASWTKTCEAILRRRGWTMGQVNERVGELRSGTVEKPQTPHTAKKKAPSYLKTVSFGKVGANDDRIERWPFLRRIVASSEATDEERSRAVREISGKLASAGMLTSSRGDDPEWL